MQYDNSWKSVGWGALVASLLMFLLALLPVAPIGLTSDSGFTSHLCYHFFHADIFHCLANIWCFLALVFYYRLSPRQLSAALVIASVVPPFALTATPTVGLSGVCFALIGIITPSVLRKARFVAFTCVWLLLGFLMPNVNAWLHLFCYSVGLLYGFITTPLSLWWK